MRRRTKQLTDGILGQHIALSVAAGLARTQLVPDPFTVYDARHLSDMLDLIAHALAKVAPLFVGSVEGAEPRPLSAEEQETATISRGATRILLKSGLAYSSITMRRGDLRQAIAVLKALGIPELAPARAQKPVPASQETSPSYKEMHAVLDEIETLLSPPLVLTQLERANRLALSIARKGPQGRVSNLAMQLMSCLHETRGAERLPDECRLKLVRLRALLDEAGTRI